MPSLLAIMDLVHTEVTSDFFNSGETDGFPLLWTPAASSFCGLELLLPSVDLSNFLLLWTQQLPQIFVQVCLPFTHDESTVQTQFLARPNFPFQPRCFIGTWNLDLLPTVANIMHLV